MFGIARMVVGVLLAGMVLVSTSMAAPITPLGQAAKNLDESSVVVYNRTIVTFRSPLLGASPEIRAKNTRQRLEALLRQGEIYEVSIRDNPEGSFVMLGEHLAFVMTAGDVGDTTQETLGAEAKAAAKRLEQVVAETHEARNMGLLLKAGGFSLVATVVFAFLFVLLRRLRNWVAAHIISAAERKAKALTIGGHHVLETQSMLPHLQRLINGFLWFVMALLAYEWASFVLSRFPYTRPWGEQLNSYLYNLIAMLAESIVDALPGLIVALSIFLLARFFVGFVGRLLGRLANSNDDNRWLNFETAPTTQRLVSIGIWLFALAMAYPYLPGAQTDAFKGLSVLLGLMVSLGASSIVGQGAAGLILTYTRTIRPGEYVRIGEHEGTVVDMGMFTTRIQTGLGEELTLPNSMITGTVTKNYSRVVRGRGYVVDTTVTIGYDTPWRQVEAMLIESARRTPGILTSPAPVVFQTALSDYYPEYRLVAQAVPEQPRPRAEVLSLLHANIQDVFNEYGVQIMSPHYLGDPEQAKVVPPEGWYAEPAKRQE